MFQHGSVATDKTRNVQFEPAMNQNSSTLQPDQFEHASARFEYQQLSKSAPMPLQVPKTASTSQPLGHGIDFLQADLRGFHASPGVPSCVPADVHMLSVHAFLSMWITASVNRITDAAAIACERKGSF